MNCNQDHTTKAYDHRGYLKRDHLFPMNTISQAARPKSACLKNNRQNSHGSEGKRDVEEAEHGLAN